MIEGEREKNVIGATDVIEAAATKNLRLYGIAIQDAAVFGFERGALGGEDRLVRRIPIDAHPSVLIGNTEFQRGPRLGLTGCQGSSEKDRGR